MKKNGLLAFIGPSGAGKNTLINRLRKMPLFQGRDYFSISWTTRPSRPDEVDGVHYYFRTREEFKAAISRGEFLEWAEFSGNLYGTPLTPIADAVDQGMTIFIDLETIGAVKLKQIAQDRGWSLVDMFIAPPSMEVLEQRLARRGNVPPDQMTKRLETARVEMGKVHLFNHKVVNDDLDRAETQVLQIYRQYFEVV